MFRTAWRAPLAGVWLVPLVLTLSAASALAQEATSALSPAARPAFSLSSGQIYTTQERPFVQLGFQQLAELDFRVYKVRNPVQFFRGLREAHVLGSPEPLVPQEQTLIERLAIWKAEWRARFRAFARAQLSEAYRARRREQRDTQTVQQRRVVGATSFAQVPLLNEAQLVTSWREILPNVRDTEFRRIPLELSAAGIYLVEAVHAPYRAYTIVIVSDLGLVTKTAPGQLLAFAADRKSGEPRPGCRMEAIANRQSLAAGSTDEVGVFLADLPDVASEEIIAVAQCGDETVVGDPGAFFLREPPDELVAYIYTDKPIYRPQHVVHFKAILRRRVHGALAAFGKPTVEVAVTDSADKVVHRESLPVDSFGAVHGSLKLASHAALGYYTIQIRSDDQLANGSFEVQEYRRPEFEVTVAPATRFVLQGAQTTAKVTARYYFGQPVAGATLKYAVYRTTYYSPLRWLDGEEGELGESYFYSGEQVLENATTLDDQGEATVALPVPVDDNARDISLRVEARVTDASDREVSGAGTVIGTYGDVVVATALDQYVYAPGAQAHYRIRVVDYQGTPKASTAVGVTLERVTYPNGRYDDPRRETVSQGNLTTDADGRTTWTLAVPQASGNYRFSAVVRSAGRDVRNEDGAWVPGGRDTSEFEGDRFLELQPDRRSYAPGDVAHLLVQGEEVDGMVLVTKEADTIGWHEVVRVKPGQLIDVPITETDIGDTYVTLSFLKDNRLHRAEKRLSVPAVSRELTVSIEPDADTSKPGQPALFTVRTFDGNGQPVRASVSLAVVDDAVFAVKPDSTPDPVRFFYRLEYSRVNTAYSRTYSFIGYSGSQQLQLAQRRRPFRLADFKPDRPVRPHVRKEFPDAIYWMADLQTDESGTAAVKVAYPDALTTWRVTARAVTTDTRLGRAVARTTTSKDVIFRVITPRFLAEGDTVEIPTITHNYLPQAESVTISLGATGLDPVDNAPEAAMNTSVPSGGEQRIDWPFRAATAGTAVLTGSATGPSEGDAVELSIPVLPFGLKREVGQSGTLAAAEQRLTLPVPATANPAARQVEISLAPTLGSDLLGALDFLTQYPYGCTEQTVSAFLPNLLVLRTLAQLKLTPSERLGSLDRMVNEGIRRLVDYQHADGGWGWWKTDENHPFMTAYAVYALLEADQAGYRVDRFRLTQGVAALSRLHAQYPRAIPDLKAYELLVLAQAAARGLDLRNVDADATFHLPSALDEVWQARERLSAYGRAFLILALDAAKDGRGNALADDLARSAQVRGDLAFWRTDGDPLLEDVGDTSVEATAAAVRALARRPTYAGLAERGVKWLLASRGSGRYWSTTKQTAMVLYGLLDVLAAQQIQPSTFSVDVIVNGEHAATQTIGPEAWTRAEPVKVRAAARTGPNDVRIVKKGSGTLYWTAAVDYVDTAEAQTATGSRKLAIAREYFHLKPIQQRGRIVYREEPFSGTAAPGDLLLVRLTVAGASDWRYLIIEDPLPAGVEVVRQPQLYELERGRSGEPWWTASRREYRDTRVVQFQERLDEGRSDFNYLLKATTAGTFRAMPAQVAPMYVPGVFASTGTQTVVIAAQGER